MAAIALGECTAIGMGCLLVRLLEGTLGDVLIALGDALLRARIVMDAARSTAEGDMAIPCYIASVHAPTILEDVAAKTAVMDVHVDHSGVIEEVASAPLAAAKADAAVAEAVVHAAIVADMRTPIAFMEKESSAGPSPVAGSPKQAGTRRGHPGAGNPIIIGLIGIPSPVAGSPHQVGRRGKRLHIDRNRRRGKANADGNLCVRGDGKDGN
jgi:hypothetical protein